VVHVAVGGKGKPVNRRKGSVPEANDLALHQRRSLSWQKVTSGKGITLHFLPRDLPRSVRLVIGSDLEGLLNRSFTAWGGGEGGGWVEEEDLSESKRRDPLP